MRIPPKRNRRLMWLAFTTLVRAAFLMAKKAASVDTDTGSSFDLHYSCVIDLDADDGANP